MDLSPGDLVAKAQTWLEENPSGPVAFRAGMGVVVASGGDMRRSVTFGEVAESAGLDVGDVLTGLVAMRERHEAEAQFEDGDR